MVSESNNVLKPWVGNLQIEIKEEWKKQELSADFRSFELKIRIRNSFWVDVDIQ